tara:strand:+ start:3950 stop:4561 length:612 start_codon:yes stop_codon:yes gene_type:complete
VAFHTTPRLRHFLVWAAIVLAIAVPLAFAATSPLLAWRGPAYIVAGLAGVIAMAVLLLQPLLAGGYLPGVSVQRGRLLHRRAGVVLVVAVLVHVIGLWITSPPDVVDALTFTSPTPFSAWGVVALWAVFLSAALAVLRRRLRPPVWRGIHLGLAAVIVAGSVVHALLIEGTMETVSKALLCALIVAATVGLLAHRRLRARRQV